MQATAIVKEGWGLYKRHWRHFVPIALVVYLILGVVSLLLGYVLGALGALIAGLVSIIGFFWLQGALVEAVRDARDGRVDLSIGETFRKVQPRLPAIIAAGLIAGILIAIGFVLLIVPGLFLLTIWCLIVPAIVYEGKSAGEAFGRSRELVRGNGWSVFGVILITIAAAIVASIIVSLLLFWAPVETRGFLQSVIANTLIAPFVVVSWTLMYYALTGARTTAADMPAVATTPEPPA